MQVDSLMNKYNPRDPQRRAMEKRAAEIDAHYTKRAKNLDATKYTVQIEKQTRLNAITNPFQLYVLGSKDSTRIEYGDFFDFRVFRRFWR